MTFASTRWLYSGSIDQGTFTLDLTYDLGKYMKSIGKTEIPNVGTYLYAEAWAEGQIGGTGGTQRLPEYDGSDSEASVHMTGALARTGEQLTMDVTQENNGNGHSTAAITLRNNSLQPQTSAELVATLLDAAGTVLETKKTSVGGVIPGETFRTETVTFSQPGARVVVRAAVPGNDLLTFDGLAVGLGNFTANGTNYTYTLQNDSGATSTLVTAVSGNGDPVSINGQALSTGGSATVAIPKSSTTNIVVKIGAKTYTLTILRNSGTGGNEGSGGMTGGVGGSSSPSYSITVDKTKNGTITVSPKNASHGDTVTITATPDKGYELEMLKVLDRSGDALKLTEKNGKYSFKMPVGKVTIKVSFVEEASEQIFKDVPANAYYYEAVKWAQEKGITGGIGNGLFGPNDPCTRAQIVTFLWRAAGSPAPKNTGTAFGDVKLGSFYEQAVAWAVENGITGGTGEGMFSPDATCTLAQSVTFLYRAAGSPAVSGSAEFGDVSTTAFYADAVAWAAKKGITGGIGGGLFGSGNDCTRGQIVTFLWRCKK